jgi:hypothetical protein
MFPGLYHFARNISIRLFRCCIGGASASGTVPRNDNTAKAEWRLVCRTQGQADQQGRIAVIYGRNESAHKRIEYDKSEKLM